MPVSAGVLLKGAAARNLASQQTGKKLMQHVTGRSTARTQAMQARNAPSTKFIEHNTHLLGKASPAAVPKPMSTARAHYAKRGSVESIKIQTPPPPLPKLPTKIQVKPMQHAAPGTAAATTKAVPKLAQKPLNVSSSTANTSANATKTTNLNITSNTNLNVTPKNYSSLNRGNMSMPNKYAGLKSSQSMTNLATSTPMKSIKPFAAPRQSMIPKAPTTALPKTPAHVNFAGSNTSLASSKYSVIGGKGGTTTGMQTTISGGAPSLFKTFLQKAGPKAKIMHLLKRAGYEIVKQAPAMIIGGALMTVTQHGLSNILTAKAIEQFAPRPHAERGTKGVVYDKPIERRTKQKIDRRVRFDLPQQYTSSTRWKDD